MELIGKYKLKTELPLYEKLRKGDIVYLVSKPKSYFSLSYDVKHYDNLPCTIDTTASCLLLCTDCTSNGRIVLVDQDTAKKLGANALCKAVMVNKYGVPYTSGEPIRTK
jgi:hypothetical protein